MIDYMINGFLSFFQNPSGSGIYLAVSVGLAIGFGAAWLACYWPPLSKKPWMWAVLVSSAFLTLVALWFIQYPLQVLAWKALGHFWSQEVLIRWILLTALPTVIISGLVQEGAKLVPVVVWWRRSGRSLDPRLGLAIGAVAGAGFAIFEAQWAHNQVFGSGWTWEVIQNYGFWAVGPFWERFFTVAGHIAFSGLAGYGLARGRGWQYYLIVSALHGLLNYSTALYGSGRLTGVQVEIYIAVVALAVTGWALWLRWRKGVAAAETATETQLQTNTETQPQIETDTDTETHISAP